PSGCASGLLGEVLGGAGSTGGAPTTGSTGGAPTIGSTGGAPITGSTGGAPTIGSPRGAPTTRSTGGAPSTGSTGGAPSTGSTGGPLNGGVSGPCGQILGNLVQNCSFEQPVIPPGSFIAYGPGSTGISGWTVGVVPSAADGVDAVSSTFD